MEGPTFKSLNPAQTTLVINRPHRHPSHGRCTHTQDHSCRFLLSTEMSALLPSSCSFTRYWTVIGQFCLCPSSSFPVYWQTLCLLFVAKYHHTSSVLWVIKAVSINTVSGRWCHFRSVMSRYVCTFLSFQSKVTKLVMQWLSQPPQCWRL